MFITLIQLFGIGLSFGLAGPCFLSCAPILAAYVVGRQTCLKSGLIDAASFLVGRFLSYLLLGVIAGLSGSLLRRYFESNVTRPLHILTGIITVILGLFLIFENRCSCGSGGHCRDHYGRGGLFVLGLVIGIAPCAPLIALLLDITIMSKSVVDGMVYIAAFGLGGIISGAIIVICVMGMVRWLPGDYFNNGRVVRIFRYICSALLIILGGYLISGAVVKL